MTIVTSLQHQEQENVAGGVKNPKLTYLMFSSQCLMYLQVDPGMVPLSMWGFASTPRVCVGFCQILSSFQQTLP